MARVSLSATLWCKRCGEEVRVNKDAKVVLCGGCTMLMASSVEAHKGRLEMDIRCADVKHRYAEKRRFQKELDKVVAKLEKMRKQKKKERNEYE